MATQSVPDLPGGLHHYTARAHALELRFPRGFQAAVAGLTLGQHMFADANLVFSISALPYRTMWKYGQRGYRFVLIEAGHVGQAMYIAAAEQQLACVAIGGSCDQEHGKLMRLPPTEHPLDVLCIGHPTGYVIPERVITARCSTAVLGGRRLRPKAFEFGRQIRVCPISMLGGARIDVSDSVRKLVRRNAALAFAAYRRRSLVTF